MDFSILSISNQTMKNGHLQYKWFIIMNKNSFIIRVLFSLIKKYLARDEYKFRMMEITFFSLDLTVNQQRTFKNCYYALAEIFRRKVPCFFEKYEIILQFAKKYLTYWADINTSVTVKKDCSYNSFRNPAFVS